MPLIAVKTVGPVTSEECRELIEKMTRGIQEVLGKNPETTNVIIEEMAAENWGLDGTRVAKIRAGK